MKQHTSKVGDALLWAALSALADAHDKTAHAIRTTGGGGGGGPDVDCALIQITPASGPAVALSVNDVAYCQTVSVEGATQIEYRDGSGGLIATTAATRAAVLAQLRDADQWRWMEVGWDPAGQWLLTRVRDVQQIAPKGDPRTGTTTFHVRWSATEQVSQTDYEDFVGQVRLAGCANTVTEKGCNMGNSLDPKPSPSVDSPLVVLTIPPGLLARAHVDNGVLELVTQDGCIIQAKVMTVADSDVLIVAQASDAVEAACEPPAAVVEAIERWVRPAK